jgi:hypothetical protein
VFRQVLHGLQYAHEKGIVHRDIKPSNIFILLDGRVRILDFGIAKFLGGGSDLTQTGQQLGTPVYMSPEQVRADKSIDHRSDIYSLGVTLYFAASGKPPYDASTESQFDIFNKIVYQPVPDLVGNEKANALIRKACEKSRDDRFQSCKEWLEALDIADESPSPLKPLSSRRVSTAQSNPPVDPTVIQGSAPVDPDNAMNPVNIKSSVGKAGDDSGVTKSNASKDGRPDAITTFNKAGYNFGKYLSSFFSTSRREKTADPGGVSFKAYAYGRFLGRRLSFLKNFGFREVLFVFLLPYLVSVIVAWVLLKNLGFDGNTVLTVLIIGLYISILQVTMSLKRGKRVDLMRFFLSIAITYFAIFYIQYIRYTSIDGPFHGDAGDIFRYNLAKRSMGNYLLVNDSCSRHYPAIMDIGEDMVGLWKFYDDIESSQNDIRFSQPFYYSGSVVFKNQGGQFPNEGTAVPAPLGGGVQKDAIQTRFVIHRYHVWSSILDFSSVFKPKVDSSQFTVAIADCNLPSKHSQSDYTGKLIPRESRLQNLLKGQIYDKRPREIQNELLKSESDYLK